MNKIENINDILDKLNFYTNGMKILKKIGEFENVSLSFIDLKKTKCVLIKYDFKLYYIEFDSDEEFNQFSKQNEFLEMGSTDWSKSISIE